MDINTIPKEDMVYLLKLLNQLYEKNKILRAEMNGIENSFRSSIGKYSSGNSISKINLVIKVLLLASVIGLFVMGIISQEVEQVLIALIPFLIILFEQKSIIHSKTNITNVKEAIVYFITYIFSIAVIILYLYLGLTSHIIYAIITVLSIVVSYIITTKLIVKYNMQVDQKNTEIIAHNENLVMKYDEDKYLLSAINHEIESKFSWFPKGYYEYIPELIDIFESYRADTFKEAMNLLANDLGHRRTKEAINQMSLEMQAKADSLGRSIEDTKCVVKNVGEKLNGLRGSIEYNNRLKEYAAMQLSGIRRGIGDINSRLRNAGYTNDYEWF